MAQVIYKVLSIFVAVYCLGLFLCFRSALSDVTSRNLFAFLLVNLSFAFVELFYGMWTNR